MSFGMRKQGSTYDQYDPKVYVKENQIPVVAHHEDFTYLGKIYNWNMNLNKAKDNLKDKLTSLLNTVSALKIKPQLKIKMLKLGIYPKLTFDLKVYRFPQSWITQELDSLIQRAIRNWLELPISTCLQEMCSLPYSHAGLNIQSLNTITKSLALTKRFGLVNSPNQEIRDVWQVSKNKYVITDELLLNSNNVIEAKKKLVQSVISNALTHVNGLTTQGISISEILKHATVKSISGWSITLQELPSTLFCFARKAILNQLPTKSNLHRWKKLPNPSCPLCGQDQTNKHVLNNCSNPCALERYKTRHDAVLHLICRITKASLPATSHLFADLIGYPCTDQIFRTFRPDIAVILNGKIIVAELTICHESNLSKSKNYKLNKYSNLNEDLNLTFADYNLQIMTIEITSLGIMVGVNEFLNSLSIKNKLIAKDVINTVLGNSYDIYRARDKL